MVHIFLGVLFAQAVIGYRLPLYPGCLPRLLASQYGGDDDESNISERFVTSSMFSKTTKVPISSLTNGAFTLKIVAGEEERNLVKDRLNLRGLATLECSVEMRNDGQTGKQTKRRAGSINNSSNIRVLGKILAHVVQECVRTGEDVEDTIDFEFSNVVVGGGGGGGSGDESLERVGMGINSSGGSTGNGGGGGLGGMSKKQGKALLKADVERFNENESGSGNDSVNNDGNGGFDANGEALDEIIAALEEDDIFEDPDIFKDGEYIEVSELLIQYLALNLKPYPKKAGTEKVRYSFGDF